MSEQFNTGQIARPPRRRLVFELAAVVAASLVVSVPFCNKAFHIDDTLYLAIARQILARPWRPFDVAINWQQVTEPAWNVSISPPGYSYWLAGWMALGVTGEVGLHLVGSLWVVVLGLATYGWARRLGSWPLEAALLVVASPLVVAGQNLMLDVPMLALATGAMVLYLRADENDSVGWATAAGVLAGLAVNVKYAAVASIVVMAMDAMLARRWKLLAAAGTGLLLFAVGQSVSALAYGTPHIVHARDWITRLFPTDWTDALHRSSSSIVYLGSSVGWLVLLAGGLVRRSWTALLLMLVAAAGAAAAIVHLRRLEWPPHFTPAPSWPCHPALLMCGLFAFSGWLALGWLAIELCGAARSRLAGGWAAFWSRAESARPVRHAVVLLAWTVAFWYLGTLNGPFVAPRSGLPCVLSLVLGVLALSSSTQGPGPAARGAAVALTLMSGLAVGAGDFQWADVYRDWAPRVAAKYRPTGGTLYFLGHWGWQHYAEAAGMVPLDPMRTRLEPGDVLVLPLNVDRQVLPPAVAARCRQVGREPAAATAWLPRTRDLESLIFFHGDIRHGRIPWGFSATATPLEVFVVLRYGD